MTLTQRRGSQVSYSSRRNPRALAGLSCEARYAGRSINTGPLAKTILLVDDEPCLLEVRRLVFEALGYRVLTADSGEEALEVLQADVGDSVVLDYLLTGMDGAETGRRIRKAHPNLPIILSSCQTRDHTRLSRLVFHNRRSDSLKGNKITGSWLAAHAAVTAKRL